MKIKKISSMLLLSSTVLFAASAFAGQELIGHSEYNLMPHEQKTVKGKLFKASTLNCKVRAKGNEHNPIIMTALKKRIIVNGYMISEGSATTIVVNPGDTIRIELDNRSKLGLTNDGSQLVNLRCS